MVISRGLCDRPLGLINEKKQDTHSDVCPKDSLKSSYENLATFQWKGEVFNISLTDC